jgi:hypothetical protein
MKKINLLGMTFGRLTVAGEYASTGDGVSRWECRCACGENIVARGADLRSGNTTSCGCYRKDTTRGRALVHGQYGTHLYRVWADIKKRCHGKGGKGTKRFYASVDMCQEWEEFDKFYQWAIGKWEPGLVIDREDTLKGYSPENCRFVTSKDNNQNSKRGKFWIIEGKRFLSAQDAADALCCSQSHVVRMCEGRTLGAKYYPPLPQCYSIKKYQGNNQ